MGVVVVWLGAAGSALDADEEALGTSRSAMALAAVWFSAALGAYLKELVQRGRVDELAQEEHTPASGPE